jgi:hypothetical protein
MKVPSKVVLITDKREKNPYVFPKGFIFTHQRKDHFIEIEGSRAELVTGDYALQGFEGHAAVERKGSWNELATNLMTRDSWRASAAFTRLLALPHSLLALSFPVTSKVSAVRLDFPAYRVYDEFIKFTIARRVNWCCLPTGGSIASAVAAGEFLARWLVSVCYLEIAASENT